MPVLITAFLFIIASCRNVKVLGYQKKIDSISAHYVPDQRLGICSVTVKTGKDGAVILIGETTEPKAKDQIINTLDKRGIILIDSIIVLPDTTTNKRYMGLVSLSVINLRKEPDHASEMVSQSIIGTPVLILKDDKSWFLIQTPDRYIAWTENTSVVPVSRREMSEWKKSDRVIYVSNSGWIHRGVSEDSEVAGDLVAGDIMVKTGEAGDYTRVFLPDRREGFVRGKDIISFDSFIKRPLPDGEKIVHTAMSLMGIPYLWGGSSSKGVDCSGFVQYVYFRNGIMLMRDASLQALHGKAINFSNGYEDLQKGDLLFFGSRQNGEPYVTHVAIYIGNYEYINSSGMVKINSLDSTKANFSSHRLNSLLSARRIIGVVNDPGIVSLKNHPWY